MTGPHQVHTAGNAIPPLDDDLEDLIDSLRGIHPSIDLMLDGARLAMLDQHTVDTSQTMVAAIGAWENRNVLVLLGHVIARLSNSDTNPALRTLPLAQQKKAQLAGENAYRALADEDLHQTASETSAAIDGV